MYYILFHYSFAETVNTNFATIICLQFGVSMLVVCANLYKLVMVSEAGDLIILLSYTACMLSQIFLYCWFGNELKLKVYNLSIKTSYLSKLYIKSAFFVQ